ncbi:MAG: DNA polymerase III subunit alpha [Bacteroidetes bacterium]|nr:DNA polymerase III subunit alpha [Bacteroidota bacterium]
MFLIFDTETTGLPIRDDAPLSDFDNWPRAVQIAWQLHDEKGQLVEAKDFVIKPEGFDIPFNAAKVHGITTAVAEEYGIALEEAMAEFSKAVEKTTFLVGHNVQFDNNVLGCEYLRLEQKNLLEGKKVLDTGEETREYCQLPGGRGGQFKMPKLEELYEKLFGHKFAEAHNAAADVEATARSFFEALRLGIYSNSRLEWTDGQREDFDSANPTTIAPIGLKVRSFKKLAQELEAKQAVAGGVGVEGQVSLDEDLKFTHLHVHTQYSILQATCDINALINKAKEDGMPAVAMTDIANLYGAFKFVSAARAAGLKPIVGVEFYLCRNHKDRSVKDNGYQIVAIAKNKAGYHSLAKLSSHAFVDGYYYVPRIDKELLLQYKENLIITTGGLSGEIPRLILNVGEKQAEESFEWYYNQFGDDFYVELVDHGLEENKVVNQTLIRFARKYGVKFFASNDAYYLNEGDANAHDILLCVKEGEYQSTPIGRGRGYRYGFPNDQFYFKTDAEMKRLFASIPEAIANTQEIVDKVESYDLARDVLLPAFDIPEDFVDPLDEEDGGKRGENNYLKHLTYVGAEKRYGTISEDVKSRLDFELETIANTGYPGYFLIVQDFTSQARKMGVSVGPGRGSAAGSAVAYCIGITNVDPIKYDLLFERFLNPDRVSLPDIDIDFDDEGRGKIIDWVVNKYGQNQVAQIITYGTMAGKSAIRDAGRVLQLPLSETDRVAKLVPDTKLNKLFSWTDKEMGEKLNGDLFQLGKQLKELAQQEDRLEAQVVNQARILEGSVRNTGIHACGVIITPDDITKFVPVSVAKDSDLYVTQFDNSVVESAGMLKMDFLGLKTLSIIKDAIKIVKDRHDVSIDPDEIPLDDLKTFELYQSGQTNGTFQFESPGMQKHLKALKPDKFADLIAMNALYRPGPLEYIPNFIARKNGQEEISYDLPDMEEYLAETYGITVYQEQVMLLSQKLAGFTKGEADVLRKAMGKKKRDVLDKMKPQFIEQGKERGHDEEKLNKIWKDWEAFAAYAFNKSHSTCYSVVAFHTGYLKANYPAEYMASVLTHNMNDIKKVTFFMEECKRMEIPVLGPDVNESQFKFTVNEKGAIRFGLGGMKGVGENAVLAIVDERLENGAYPSFFDLLKRIDLRAVNKKTLESLALGGAFDDFPKVHRATFFNEGQDGKSFLERALRYAQMHKAQEESAQVSLFGESQEVDMPEPEVPVVQAWPRMFLLGKEKEVNGLYLSSHPLDDFRYEMELVVSNKLSEFQYIERMNDFTVAGIISDALHLTARSGKPFGRFTIEDYSGKHEFALFGDEYLKFKSYIETNLLVLIRGKVSRYTPRWEGATERIEAKITQISLIQDALDRHARGIELQLAVQDVSPENIESIDRLINEYQGEKAMNLVVFDADNPKINLRMPRRSKAGVSLTKDSLDAFKQLPFARMQLKT